MVDEFYFSICNKNEKVILEVFSKYFEIQVKTFVDLDHCTNLVYQNIKIQIYLPMKPLKLKI